MAKQNVSTTLLLATDVARPSFGKRIAYTHSLLSESYRRYMGQPFRCLPFRSHSLLHTHTARRMQKVRGYRTRVVPTRFGLTFIVPKPPTHRHIRSASDVTNISTLTQQIQSYTIVHYFSIYSTSKTCPFSVHNRIILILMSSLTPNSIPNPIP